MSSKGRLAVLTELAAEVTAAWFNDDPDPGKARAASVLADAGRRLFRQPRHASFDDAQAMGAWVSGLVFHADPAAAECPEA